MTNDTSSKETLNLIPINLYAKKACDRKSQKTLQKKHFHKETIIQRSFQKECDINFWIFFFPTKDAAKKYHHPKFEFYIESSNLPSNIMGIVNSPKDALNIDEI